MIILIPAYEPDKKLVQLVSSIRAIDGGPSVIVIDDGSGPIYRPIFDAVRALGTIVIGYSENRGKGHALKSGFAFIAERFPDQDVVCADCDGQHILPDILRVADRVRTAGGAMVLGMRSFSGEVPTRSRFGNALTRNLFRWATGQRIKDTQTGLRGYPASMLGWVQTVDGDRYEYELNLLLQARGAGCSIESVEIDTVYLDDNESSHFRPVADSVRIYAPLVKFCVSSLGAFTIDLVALFIVNALTGSLLLSVVGARVLSSVVNFSTNRNLVFEHGRDRPTGTTAVRYFGLVLVLLGANYLLIDELSNLGLPLLAAKLTTEVTLFVVSFAVQRRFLFNDMGTGSRPDQRRTVVEPTPISAATPPRERTLTT